MVSKKKNYKNLSSLLARGRYFLLYKILLVNKKILSDLILTSRNIN